MPATVSPAISPSALGIYVSVPFCRAKCSYCNFASGVFSGERMQLYVDRLIGEIHGARRRVWNEPISLPEKMDSLYFGGGTPSLIDTLQFGRILKALHDVFLFSPQSEITLECAPGQLSDALLDALPGLGFNRVSLGVQSFVDRESAAVGRLHTRKIVLEEIARLRRVGIHAINVDLIAGLPHQTPETWRVSLDQAIQAGVPHLSVYMLDVDEDSRLGREMLSDGARYGASQVPDDATIAALYAEACDRFTAAGVMQYEISNFARPGAESRHNLKYWTRQPYLGFGLDAHSFLHTNYGNDVRASNSDDLAVYLDRGAPETVTPVSSTEAIEEAWFLGLRLNQGISLTAMESRIGRPAMHAFDPVLRACRQEHLLEQSGGYIYLTARGRLFANEVFTRFLGVLPKEPQTTDLRERSVARA